MAKVLVFGDLRGSLSMARKICHYSWINGSTFLFTLGDTVSPSIVEWFTETCGISIGGIIGPLDNPSVANALRKQGVLLEGRHLELHGLRLAGIGVSTDIEELIKRIRTTDVLLSYHPGVEYSCSKPGNPRIDGIATSLKAKLVIYNNKEPCLASRAFTPGSAWRGYVGLLDLETLKPAYMRV